MDDIFTIFKNHRSEILAAWMSSVFPEYPRVPMTSVSLRFENPFLYEVHREFSEVLDYLFSDDPGFTKLPVPVAKTFVKYRALNAIQSTEVVNYPVQLRNSLIPFFSYLENKNIEILLSIDIRIERLLMSAFDFYVKTREEIFSIKLKELERGVLAGETSGCPSGNGLQEIP
jgi:hypothetical protein